MKASILRLGRGLGLLLVALSAAADPGTVSRATTLKKEPYFSAATGAEVGVNAAVEIVARNGGWYQLKTASGETGWTRMSNVRLAEAGQSSVFGKWAGLVESGRSSNTRAAATTGVRGLDEADLAKAQPNFAALDSLARYAAGPTDAAHFASELKLESTSLPLEAKGQP